MAREPSEHDRRVTLAVLTDAGRATLEAAAPVHVAGVRRHFVDHLLAHAAAPARYRVRGVAAAARPGRSAGDVGA